MRYAFPNDLAEQVMARWQTFVAKHDQPAPPLPGVEELRFVLETAFVASFAREEGRNLRFVLCCSPLATVPREGATDAVPLVAFQDRRPLTVDTLRSLGPAVSPANAAILVQCPTGGGPAGCAVVGVLNVGTTFARARRGRSIYHRAAAYALVIDVRDAGELHIYRGAIKLATLKGGSLQDQLAFSELEFLPISDILTAGAQALGASFERPATEPGRETSDFEWTALLNTVLAIVNGLEDHGHGATLLIVKPGSEGTLPVRVKFDVDASASLLSERFITFINARHAFVDARLRSRQGEMAAADAVRVDRLVEREEIAEDALGDAADLVARLSAVDGALVVRSDMRLLGFGAEIVLDTTKAVTAYEVSGHHQRGSSWPLVDSESFGMRHRSALRCVAEADGTAAFVVSQDGTVSLFWKQDGRVLLKRGVTTANPNMAGA
jgi:hypothetical protein